MGIGDHPMNSDHHRGCDHPRNSGCLRDFYHPKGWLLNFGSVDCNKLNKFNNKANRESVRESVHELPSRSLSCLRS